MGVSLNGGTPNLHPKMMILSRKTYGCWGNPPFFWKPPYRDYNKPLQLGGGFNHCLFSPLLGEMIQLD